MSVPNYCRGLCLFAQRRGFFVSRDSQYTRISNDWIVLLVSGAIYLRVSGEHKKGSLRGCLKKDARLHYWAAGFLRRVAGAFFFAGVVFGAAFVSNAPLLMVMTKGLGS